MAGFMDGVNNYQAFQGYGSPIIPPNLFGLGDSGVINTSPLVATATKIPAASPLEDRGLFSSFLQQKYADGSTGGGWGSAGLGTLQGIGNMYMGLKNYGLQQDQLAFQKDIFNKNYAAQRQATNTGLEDRQMARVAANPGAYQSVGEYMQRNRIA